MNESELKRVQDDLATMRQVVGLAVPPFTIAQVWGFLWLAFTGLLLIVIALVPSLIPSRWGGLLVVVCWVALPVSSLTRRLIGRPAPDFERSQKVLPKLSSLTVVVFGVIFFLWARILGLPWPITMSMLFFIAALPLLIASVSESRRRSGIGLALALITYGLGFPFVAGNGLGLLLGTAIFSGCSLSAGILYWQLCRHESFMQAK